MLGAQRRLEVDDGTIVNLDPRLTVVWPDVLTCATPARRLRVLRVDQRRGVTAAYASGLVAEGLATFDRTDVLARGLIRAGARLTSRADGRFVRDLATRACVRRGLIYGCGAGDLFTDPVLHDIDLDGVERHEDTLVSVLEALSDGEQVARRRPMLSDPDQYASPGAYDFAVSPWPVLRDLGSMHSVRRHVRLAGLNVAPGGFYAACVESWRAGGGPWRVGSTRRWRLEAAADGADAPEAYLRCVARDPRDHMELVETTVRNDDAVIVRAHEVCMSLPLTRWISTFTSHGPWRLVSTRPASGVSVRDPMGNDPGQRGLFWLVFRRTGQ
jgi:hypothetical protein